MTESVIITRQANVMAMVMAMDSRMQTMTESVIITRQVIAMVIVVDSRMQTMTESVIIADKSNKIDIDGVVKDPEVG
jgi:hypothetical protein